MTILGGRGALGIGGAVVQDSRSLAEYDECLLKARYFESIRAPIELIETLKFDGNFVRLDGHLARLRKSAIFLGIRFDGIAARAALNGAVKGAVGALRVRLTLDEGGMFACTASPVGAVPLQWSFAISPYRVNSTDMLLRHKTSWRAFYDDERERLAKLTGSDEAVFLNERGELTEGSRTNIFVRCDGRLVTPPLCDGVLDGVLRQELIESGICVEAVLSAGDLASEVYLGNSLRGLIPASQVTASWLMRGA